MNTIDYVNLIKNNPINKFNEKSNNKLLEKINLFFSEKEQKIFITNFYCYLNYDKDKDYIISIDDIWEWLEFYKKANCKKLLLKCFQENKDYIIKKNDKNIKQYGGQNKEHILLNINCFKSLCLKADTKISYEIHNYYIKLENLINEIYEEQVEELKNITSKIQKDKKDLEKELIKNFPINTECIYIGTIDNTNEDNEKLIKFGHTNNLEQRIHEHNKTYDNFVLKSATKVSNKQEIENLIKKNKYIKEQIRTIEVKGKNKTEIIAYDDKFTIDDLKKIVNDIIKNKTYSPENFNKLQEEYNNYKEDSEKEISTLKEEQENLNKKNIYLCNERDKFEELHKQEKKENDKLKEQVDNLTKLVEEYVSNNKPDKPFTDEKDNDDNILKYKKFINECCIVRKDVEVESLEITGQFRIWVGEKPKRELFEGFNTYLKQNFIEKRLANKEKQQNVRGFEGIKLKQIEYKKVKEQMNLYETFIFEKCRFNPTYKDTTKYICEEGLKYIHKLGKGNGLDDKEHIKNIKTYLKECPYTLGGPIRSTKDGTTQEGYYGISLFENIETTYRKNGDVSGKNVEKVDSITNEIIETYKSIVEAGNKNNLNEARIRYCIKNNIICNDNSYYRKKVY